jgi:hypothetical protein
MFRPASGALYLLLKGKSALHIAATDNNVDAIKLLLLNGASVNAKDYCVSIFVC